MNKSPAAKRRLSLSGLLLRLVLAYLLIAFVFYPNLNLLAEIFFVDGKFSNRAVSMVFHSARAMTSLKNSFILAVTLSVTVNIVGTLVVLFTEYWDIKGAKLLKVAYMTPLVYGGIVLVTSYKQIYGAKGLLTKLLLHFFPNMNPGWFVGYGAVVFVMTFACTSNHVIFLSNAIHGMDYHVIEASKNMGASGFRTFFQVVLPTLRPTYFAVTILTFLTGLSALSAPMIVGGTEFETINPLIVAFAATPGSRDIAAMLAVILGLLTILLLTIMNKIEKGGNYISISKTKAKMVKQKINSKPLNILAHVSAYIIFLIYTVPILLVIYYSFNTGVAVKTGEMSLATLTLDNYRKLFSSARNYKPYLVSFAYSLGAALIVALIAVIVSRIMTKSHSKLDSFFEYGMLVPWLLPATLIALGLMLTYDSPNPVVFNKVLYNTLVIMLIGYVVVKMPFSYRMIRAAFYGVEGDLEEASQCMGASPLYTMVRVIIPLIFPSVLSVIVMNFNSMLSDYDMSALLFHPLYKPLGIVIKNNSDNALTSDAMAMTFVYAVIIIIISSIAIYFTLGPGPEHVKKLKKRLSRG